MNPVAMNLAPALWAVEFAATLAFALSGRMEASRKRLDAVGVVVVAGLAAFGGVLRDIVCNEIPTAFRDHRPYALCAFAGGWVVVALRAAGADETAALALGTVVAFALRALALWRNWRVPAWQTD